MITFQELPASTTVPMLTIVGSNVDKILPTEVNTIPTKVQTMAEMVVNLMVVTRTVNPIDLMTILIGAEDVKIFTLPSFQFHRVI